MSNLSRRGFLATGFILGGQAMVLGACTATVTPARTDVARADVARTDVAVVRVAPPPPRYEAPPPLPPERATVEVWQPGYWRWSGNEHVWVPGRYVTRPRPGATWVAGRWEQRGGGWVFIEGHWA